MHHLFGLKGQEVLEPSYLDVKHFNDLTAAYRGRLREKIRACRKVSGDLAQTRDLLQRYHLKHELELAQKQICLTWAIYKVLQKDATRVCDAYYQYLTLHKVRAGKP